MVKAERELPGPWLLVRTSTHLSVGPGQAGWRQGPPEADGARKQAGGKYRKTAGSPITREVRDGGWSRVQGQRSGREVEQVAEQWLVPSQVMTYTPR